MGIRALATVLATFDVFLGVVPSATGVGHEERQDDATDGDADQKTGQRFQTPETDDNRCDYGDEAGQDHFPNGASGRNVYAFGVIRLGFTFQ